MQLESWLLRGRGRRNIVNYKFHTSLSNIEKPTVNNPTNITSEKTARYQNILHHTACRQTAGRHAETADTEYH